MTRQDYTDLTLIVDRSGSMANIAQDMVGGIKSFLEEQRKVPGKCLVNLYQFDSYYDTVFEDKYVHDVPVITLEPRGSTALRDAIGRTINRAGERFRKMPEHERPARVFVVVVTDGMENASREFNASQIREMVDHQKNTYLWNFIFLGANQDAVLTVNREMGLGAGKGYTYQPTKDGVEKAFNTLSNNMVSARSCSLNSYQAAVQSDSFYTDEDKNG